MLAEYITSSIVYSIAKDGWNYIRGRRRRLKPADVLQLRQKWKVEFEGKIAGRRNGRLDVDVIIRDVKRIDSYPDIDEKGKGISPWFKVGLMGTYHRGILAGLSWVRLIQDASSGTLRPLNVKNGECDGVKAILVGYIPYENIEAVDWEGDEYYGNPIIYCHFDGKGKEPYERLAYCEEKCISTGFPFYTDIAPYIPPVKKRWWQLPV